MTRTAFPAVMLLTLAACGEPDPERADLIEVGTPVEEAEGWDEPADLDAPLPPPNDFDAVIVDVPTPGAPMDVAMAGMDPGASVTLMVSTSGIGAGPCPAPLGGLCIDVTNPRIVASGVADANGRATLTVNLPGTVPVGVQLWVQAVVANGAASSSSTVDTAVISDCPLRADIGLAGQGPTGAVTIAPEYVGVGLVGILDDGAVHDYFWDADGNGVDELYTSGISLTLYDAAFTELCTVAFDGSTGVEVAPTWTTSSGGALYAAWELSLLGDGWTDCGPLDPTLFPVSDARSLFRGTMLGVGLGEVVDTRADLQAGFGASWASVQPDIYGAYVSWDLLNADEVGYGFGLTLQDCATIDPALTTLPSNPNPPEAAYDISPLYLYTL